MEKKEIEKRERKSVVNLDALVRRDIIMAFASLHEVSDNLTDLMQNMIGSKDKRVVSARFHLEEMKKHVDKLRA